MVRKTRKKEDGESKKEQGEESIVENFLSGIPVLGNLVKELGKTEVFREKFKETDEKIKENLRKGEKKKWSFEARLSVRPIIEEIKKDSSEISLHEDYIYGRKGNHLTLVVKVPQEEVHCRIEGKNLILNADNFEKEIELPDYFSCIRKKKYQKGTLFLELTK